MNETNSKFKRYCESLKVGSSQDIQQSLSDYHISRRLVTWTILQDESGKWQNVLQHTNTKDLWLRVDWKGNITMKLKVFDTILVVFPLISFWLWLMAKEMFSNELYTMIIFHTNVLRPFSSLLAKVYMRLNV